MSTTLEAVAPPSPNGQDAALEFITHLQDRWRLAQYMVASGMIPQKRPEEAITVMLKGYELGIPPMMAAANIHVIKGNPTLSAHLMLGLAAQRGGVRWKVLSHDDTACSIRFSRAGWEDHVETYQLDQAKKAGLDKKDNWKNDPKAMLFARAASRGVRAMAPDVLAGQYAYEEADSLPDRGTPVGADELNAHITQEQKETIEAEDEVADDTVPDDPEEIARLEVRYEELVQAAHPEWTAESRGSWEKLMVKRPPAEWAVADYRKLIERLEASLAKATAG